MESAKAVKKSAWRRAMLLAGIGVVAAGSVAGVSFALTSSTNSNPAASTPSTPSTSSSGTKQDSDGWGQIRRAKVREVLQRAVSGQIELRTNSGFVTVEFDRGVVSSISSSSVSVLRSDSKTITEAITSKTHMPKRGTPAKGQQVVVVSEGGNALYVIDVGAPASGPKKGTSGTGTSSNTSSSSTSVS
jgi:hypothetical protein